MPHTKSSRRSRHLIAAAGAAVVGLAASPAHAGFQLEVLAISATTSGPGVIDPKFVVLSNVGDTVTLGLFATVNGTNGINDDSFTSVHGLLSSFGGDRRGNLVGGYVPAFFTAGASQNGSVLDWDSDGDLDIGLSPTNSSITGKFVARSLAPTALPSLGGLVQVGQFVYTETIAGSFTNVNFTIRNNNGGNVNAAALWFEDGGTISKNPTNSPVNVGASVVIGIPEPASLGLMGLASLGLLTRRR